MFCLPEFDGKILNPSNIEINLPFWIFKRLKKLHLLERDRPMGKMRIRERMFGMMEIWDGPDFRRDHRFRAFDRRGKNALHVEVRSTTCF